MFSRIADTQRMIINPTMLFAVCIMMCTVGICTAKASDVAPPPSNLTHNCSFVQHGVCLHDAYPILRSFGTVDIGECCGNCSADPACVSWNINTGMKACFLRGSFRPNPGAECTSGCLRGACGA